MYVGLWTHTYKYGLMLKCFYEYELTTPGKQRKLYLTMVEIKPVNFEGRCLPDVVNLYS